MRVDEMCFKCAWVRPPAHIQHTLILKWIWIVFLIYLNRMRIEGVCYTSNILEAHFFSWSFEYNFWSIVFLVIFEVVCLFSILNSIFQHCYLFSILIQNEDFTIKYLKS